MSASNAFCALRQSTFGIFVTLIVSFSVAGSAVAEPTALVDGPEFVDVFVPKQDGFPAIRIPSLICAQDGTLVAFAEGRQGGDHSGNVMLCKRSSDQGSTWSSAEVIARREGLAINNPQALVLDSGRVLLMYQVNRLGEFKAQPGYGPDSYQTFVLHSDDHGKTWSEPRDVSRQVKRAERVTSVASGPGIGIVLRRGPHRGRILMPMNQGPFGDWRVYAAISDDAGETWTMGDVAPEDPSSEKRQGHANEVQFAELSDGRVYLNARTQGTGNTKRRKIALSEDGGQTWCPLRDDDHLIEPTCQASLLRFDPVHLKQQSLEQTASSTQTGKPCLLFLNPASTKARDTGTLRISRDDGQTWQDVMPIYAGGFAYSCMTQLTNGDLGVLFEADGYRRIVFGRIAADKIVQATTGE
ncbi:MAG: sialidase family protein [Planctomycetota bacterium]